MAILLGIIFSVGIITIINRGAERCKTVPYDACFIVIFIAFA